MSTQGWKPRWIFRRTSEAYSFYHLHGLIDVFYGAILIETII